ncbi:hypothetical protein BsWGS_17959 [Bradybaena similaris]
MIFSVCLRFEWVIFSVCLRFEWVIFSVCLRFEWVIFYVCLSFESMIFSVCCRFEVFVKNLDGKTYTIEVDQFETVSAFKQKVGQKLGVAMEQQRITSQEGKTLADDNLSLHDYKIRKHSTLYCQGRLRGGGSQV